MPIWPIFVAGFAILVINYFRLQRAQSEAGHLRAVIRSMFDVWRERERAYQDAIDARR